MNNKQRILDLLYEKGEASIRDITINLWIQTPQEYIRQLRLEGYNIVTEYPEGQKYGVYKLITKEQMELSL
uniref:Putative DNA binding, helix-turn-helix domain containing protein n=1 Tax=viral metagenome TaxID=1070528 RepID=A0A6M3IHU6_9ZZZZ